jgi:predicted AlkP superfamily phosphohydrolase/phosphomutase
LEKTKVLIIGLDGATLDLMLLWVHEGKLPTLAKLLADGAYGELASTFPPMSAQAWTSFMTGCNIGKHGLVDFLMRKADSYELQIVNATTRDGPTLWGLLSEAGHEVGVINVPMTYPPETVKGLMISGMDAPSLDSAFTHPASLRQELLQAVPNYVIESGGHNYIHGSRQQPERYIQTVLQTAQARLDATLFAMDRLSWDLLFTVFRLTDTTPHWFWKHMDPDHPLHIPGDEAWSTALERVYQVADESIDTLLQACDDDTTVVVASDHGFAPLGERIIYLNTWLHQQGLLSFKGSPQRGAQYLFVNRVLWPAWRGLKRHVPTAPKRWLKRSFPQLERQVRSMLALSGIDWSNTQAYAFEVRPAIWINLQGREPEGIVPPGDEYETLRTEIVDRLHLWRDPIDDEPVVERVYRREELYHGPHLDQIPDLLIQFRAPQGYGYHLRQGNMSDRKSAIGTFSQREFASSLRPNAAHSLHGMCLLKGPFIRRGAALREASIVDVAPTVLHLMGEEIPQEMDGRVLVEAIDPDWLADHPPRYSARRSETRDRDVTTYAKEESQQVEERLRGLGYLG